MTNEDLDARLKLIAKAAPDLRKAGVTSLAIGDIELELAPPDPLVEPATTSTATPDHPYDPLQDPATYGGELPRRRGEQPPKDDDRWPTNSGGKPPKAKRTS
jgi:hypothetical protein